MGHAFSPAVLPHYQHTFCMLMDAGTCIHIQCQGKSNFVRCHCVAKKVDSLYRFAQRMLKPNRRLLSNLVETLCYVCLFIVEYEMDYWNHASYSQYSDTKEVKCRNLLVSSIGISHLNGWHHLKGKSWFDASSYFLFMTTQLQIYWSVGFTRNISLGFILESCTLSANVISILLVFTYKGLPTQQTDVHSHTDCLIHCVGDWLWMSLDQWNLFRCIHAHVNLIPICIALCCESDLWLQI